MLANILFVPESSSADDSSQRHDDDDIRAGGWADLRQASDCGFIARHIVSQLFGGAISTA
jgi:hypothetical protein